METKVPQQFFVKLSNTESRENLSSWFMRADGRRRMRSTALRASLTTFQTSTFYYFIRE
jgi:hypothetical protein